MNHQSHQKKSPLETLHINSRKVSCQGKTQSENSSHDSLGHPIVYLNMGEDDSVTCPYCGKFFIYKKATQQIINE